ncbi:uncharacterized protein LOC106165201 [Lingula anatina]|uniref:Uncharacterized protein LOC106165201 n=1 Tax=Lingula anatina TaxID=7574 RepID=A0A1S3IMK4_LINAN|nr:uncharacterized protein LOC106165201 [Lingula anatina]|eukprot:XP_013398764.1 uncharacterized protein LOC106165201 [Lingula anatina]
MDSYLGKWVLVREASDNIVPQLQAAGVPAESVEQVAKIMQDNDQIISLAKDGDGFFYSFECGPLKQEYTFKLGETFEHLMPHVNKMAKITFSLVNGLLVDDIEMEGAGKMTYSRVVDGNDMTVTMSAGGQAETGKRKYRRM